MNKCLREKCQKEFEPKTGKSKFCSSKCRVYHFRETSSAKPKKPNEDPLKFFSDSYIEEIAAKIIDAISKKKEPVSINSNEPVNTPNKKEDKESIEQYWQQRFRKKLG